MQPLLSVPPGLERQGQDAAEVARRFLMENPGTVCNVLVEGVGQKTRQGLKLPFSGQRGCIYFRCLDRDGRFSVFTCTQACDFPSRFEVYVKADGAAFFCWAAP